MSEQPKNAIELSEKPMAERSSLIPSTSVIERLTTIANAVAGSRMFGIRTPQEAFAKIMLGWEHGIGAMAACAEIDVIEGKPALNARTQVAIVRNRKLGNIELASVDQNHAKVKVTRTDWPAERCEFVTFTAEDGVLMGKLVKKPDNTIVAAKAGSNWAKHRESMMIARACSLAAHRYFQEVFLGMPYTPDELGAETDEAGRPITVQFSEVHDPAPMPMPAIITPDSPVDAQSAASPQAPPPPFMAPAVGVEASKPELPASVQQAPDQFADGLQAIEESTLLKEYQNRARELLTLCRLDQPTWRQFLMHHFGVTTMSGMNASNAKEVVAQLDRLHKVDRLRLEKNVNDFNWARALEKRGVKHVVELSAEQAQEMIDKMAADLTPFRRQELGLESVPVGSAAGNVSSPAGSEQAPPAQPSLFPAPAPQVQQQQAQAA